MNVSAQKTEDPQRNKNDSQAALSVSSSTRSPYVQIMNNERRFSITEVPHKSMFTPVLYICHCKPQDIFEMQSVGVWVILFTFFSIRFERVGWRPFVEPTPAPSVPKSNATTGPQEALCHINLDASVFHFWWKILLKSNTFYCFGFVLFFYI